MKDKMFCPFCGDKRISAVMDSFRDRRGTSAYMVCANCLAKGPVATNMEVAAQRWNHRHGLPTPKTESDDSKEDRNGRKDGRKGS